MGYTVDFERDQVECTVAVWNTEITTYEHDNWYVVTWTAHVPGMEIYCISLWEALDAMARLVRSEDEGEPDFTLDEVVAALTGESAHRQEAIALWSRGQSGLEYADWHKIHYGS